MSRKKYRKRKYKTQTPQRNALYHEPQIRKLIGEGLTREQIANEIGISSSSVSAYCDILGLRIPRKKRETTNGLGLQIGEILELRKSGKTLNEIGQQFGVSRERIRQVLAKHAPDVAIQTRIPSGRTCPICNKEYHGSARACSPSCTSIMRNKGRFDRDKIERIMWMRDLGMTWEKVAISIEDNSVNVASWRTRLGHAAKTLMNSTERKIYLPPRCNTSTKTDCCASEGTKENESTKPQSDGLSGQKATCLDSLVNWLRFRL